MPAPCRCNPERRSFPATTQKKPIMMCERLAAGLHPAIVCITVHDGEELSQLGRDPDPYQEWGEQPSCHPLS